VEGPDSDDWKEIKTGTLYNLWGALYSYTPTIQYQEVRVLKNVNGHFNKDPSREPVPLKSLLEIQSYPYLCAAPKSADSLFMGDLQHPAHQSLFPVREIVD